MEALLQQLAELNDKYLDLEKENETLKKEIYQLKIELVIERQKNKQLSHKEK
jgi:hypothetical protein